MSIEARALRRSYAVFKSGVDPDTLVTTLYSKFLLTPDERAAALNKHRTPGERLDGLFTSLERRVSVDPQAFQQLLDALLSEPALASVANKIRGKGSYI